MTRARWLRARGIRAFRRRLRANYLRQRERDRVAMEKHIKDNSAHALTFAAMQVQEAEDRLGRVAAEIVRLRLEYGPFKFGKRFMMKVQVAEQAILQARDLKGLTDEVINLLARGAAREFAAVDFARVQPDRIEDGQPVYAFEHRRAAAGDDAQGRTP